MIIGIGNDLVQVSRVKNILSRQGKRFSERILTELELESLIKTRYPEKFLAKRYAVKEAASKALGTGIAEGVSFHDFHIDHDNLGAPLLKVSGRAAEIASEKKINCWHITITDEKKYAVAMVIAENAAENAAESTAAE